MYKGILSPGEIENLYTHWPELELRKLERFARQSTAKARVFVKRLGRALEGEVLDTRPIVVAPFRDGMMALNGKHRSVVATFRGAGLLFYRVESANDICHGLPRSLYDDLVPQGRSAHADPNQAALLELFNSMHMYHQICASRGIQRIGDYFKRADVRPGAGVFMDAQVAALLAKDYSR